MKNLFIQDVIDMLDIAKIEDYNNEFMSVYPDWKPFVTKDNFSEYLKSMKELREGLGDDGVKEIFYWYMEDDKIIGSGSIRLNPEADKIIEIYAGHIFYQIVPSKRKQGYGTILCHLLLEKMYELGYKEAIISCYDTNIGSINIIENNSGELIETVKGDGSPNSDNLKTRSYKIDIEKSLSEFNKQVQNQK